MSAQKSTQTTPLRLGCIGSGMIVNAAHIPAYVDLRKDVVLTAIYSNTGETAQAAKENYIAQMEAAGAKVDWEVHVCATPGDLLAIVDVADVCTPTRYHAHYAQMALEANVHVMSEKPTSRNWLEARRLREAAENSGALYQLNDDNVFLPRYQHIKNVLSAGMIGEVSHILLTRGTPSSDRSAWFFDPLSGGGAILDYGSHAVMGAWFLLGLDKNPTYVKSTGIRVKERTRLIGGHLQDIETDDDAHFKIQFQNPKNGDFITAMLEATWSWPDMARNASDTHGYIRVDGTKGVVTSYFDENDKEFIRVEDYEQGVSLIPIQSYRSETLSFRDEIQSFIACIRANRQSMLDAGIAEKVMQMINAAQISELRGRVAVSVDEVPSYLAQFDDGSGDMQKIGDAIALELTKPYRKS